MTQTQAAPISTSRKRVFNSVFPSASLDGLSSSTTHIAQKPTASEQVNELQYVAGSNAKGLPTALSRPVSNPTSGTSNEPWVQQENWDRAWHVATSFLAVPDKGFEVLVSYEREQQQVDELEILEQWNRSDSLSKGTAEALAYVIRGGSGSPDRDLLGWYGIEVRRHFLRNFRGGLLQVCGICFFFFFCLRS